ncbi:hypothetical protein [Adhaeretor mobilis]|uniref:Uncharacterized protein n=1 Tax=Adhaeretor mobilis TaxID=1930276 RepID=A0A517MS95_9BACT|nr:hypothetical protein [Adhaeretor mobilis]QDS97746.1 hypothetical protein HG15A2_10130 [Adhaeretor mobilis]
MPTPADSRGQVEAANFASVINFPSQVQNCSASGSNCVLQLDGSTSILTGSTGDHPLVLNFLTQTQQLPLAEEFQSRLDHPTYQSHDRLIVWRDKAIVAHLMASHQTAWFAGERLPIVSFCDFESLPEFDPNGYDRQLLATAESIATQGGAVVAFMRTRRVDWFEQQGWTQFRNQGHTRANTLAVLSHIEANEQSQQRRRRGPRLEVTSWRHFQLDAIRDLYDSLASDMWGVLQRSEPHWQWLTNRKAHDQILTVCETRKSPRPSSEPTRDPSSDQGSSAGPDFQASKTVAYAVVRDSCIVELLVLPGYEAARTMLLKRACQDAIDRDHHFVALHTSPDDPLHEFLVTAGGQWIADATTPAGAWMAKLLSPTKWVEKLYSFLHQRARAYGIERPVQIDFQGCALSGNEPQSEPKHALPSQRFILTRRSARLEPTSEMAVQALPADWQAVQELLLLNHRPTVELQASISTELLSVLNALFPNQLFWRSPFESIKL